MTEEQALYLYCFARSDLLPGLEGRGMEGYSPPALHHRQGIAAVFSMVSLEEFTGPEAEARFQNMDWIGPRVVHHERVIEQVMEHSPVFPARFGTLFSNVDRLEALATTHHQLILGFLQEMAHKGEWAVKGFVDRTRAREAFIEETVARKAGLLTRSPGARYLQEKRIRNEAEHEGPQRARQLCDGLLRLLSPLADRVAERTVVPGGAGASPGNMVVNWAFLVDDGKLDDFRQAILIANETHAAAGVVFQFSGPWPPYSFTPQLPTEGER